MVGRHGREVRYSTELRAYRHEFPAQPGGALLIPDSVAEVCDRAKRPTQLLQGMESDPGRHPRWLECSGATALQAPHELKCCGQLRMHVSPRCKGQHRHTQYDEPGGPEVPEDSGNANFLDALRQPDPDK